jgi:hypothetical protein
MVLVNFLPWLLWERFLEKERAKNAKIFEELGKNKAIVELAERNPEVREALRTLGVKTPEVKPRDDG